MKKNLEDIIKERKIRLNELRLEYKNLYQNTSFLDLLNEVGKKGVTQGEFAAYKDGIEAFEGLFNKDECLKLDLYKRELFFDRDYMFFLGDNSLLIINSHYIYNYKDVNRNIKLSAKIVPIDSAYVIIQKKEFYENYEKVNREVLTVYNKYNPEGENYYINEEVDFSTSKKIYVKQLLIQISMEEIVGKILESEVHNIKESNSLRKIKTL